MTASLMRKYLSILTRGGARPEVKPLTDVNQIRTATQKFAQELESHLRNFSYSTKVDPKVLNRQWTGQFWQWSDWKPSQYDKPKPVAMFHIPIRKDQEKQDLDMINQIFKTHVEPLKTKYDIYCTEPEVKVLGNHPIYQKCVYFYVSIDKELPENS